MATARRQGRNFSIWNRLATVASIGAVACLAALPRQAHAQIGSGRYSSIVVEAGSGQVLESASPDALRHPASLTKLMTLYMAFEALRDRRIALDQYVPISSHAASMSPTKLGLVPGTRITVDQAILGLVTKSANDAAAALGEMLGGSEDRFAQMMTLRARALGMTHTTFMNASGLPDPEQWTTARDMAILARRLISGFPGYYKYFSTPSFVWQRRVIGNHDHLLKSYPGADGMKTGYTQASGYNLVSSAVRGGVRLVGVVMGASGAGERDAHMMSLLDQGYGQLDIPTDRAVVRAASHSPIASAQAATVERPTPRGRAPEAIWGIQAGTHPTEKAARTAAFAARRVADDGIARTEPVTVNHKTVWRAQVTGLSQADARGACAALTKHKTPCSVLRIDPRMVASR
jgi:D-alanyl-D-alanine carboxypeptidase